MNAHILFVQFLYRVCFLCNGERTTILQVLRFDLGIVFCQKTEGSSTLKTGFSSVRTFNFTHFRKAQVAVQFSVFYHVTREATVYQKFHAVFLDVKFTWLV